MKRLPKNCRPVLLVATLLSPLASLAVAQDTPLTEPALKHLPIKTVVAAPANTKPVSVIESIARLTQEIDALKQRVRTLEQAHLKGGTR